MDPDRDGGSVRVANGRCPCVPTNAAGRQWISVAGFLADAAARLDTGEGTDFSAEVPMYHSIEPLLWRRYI